MSHQLPIAERIRCSTRVQALLKQSHTVIRSRWMDEQLSGYKMCLDEYPQLYWKVLFYLFRPDLERQIEPQVTESALLYFMVEFGWVPILYHTGIKGKDKDQLNARLEHYWQCYIDDAASNQPVSREELGDVPREFPYRFAQTLNFPYQFYNLSHVSFLGWLTRSSINTTSIAMTQNLVSLFERFRDCAQKGEDILTTNYVVHVRFAYILSVSTLFRIAAQNVEQQCEELQETVSENRVEMVVYFSDSDNGPKIRKYLNKEMFRYFVQDKTFRELCQKSLFPQKEKVKEEKKEAALPNEEEIVIMPEKYCDWLFGERLVYDCVKWGKPFVTVKVFNRLCSKCDTKKVNSLPQLGPDDDPVKQPDLVEWMPYAYEKYLRSIAILPSRANWTCSQLMVMFNDSMREFVLNEVTKELHSARTKLRDQIIWLVVVGRRAHKKAQDYLRNPSADDDDDSDSSEDSDSDGDDEAASDDDTTQCTEAKLMVSPSPEQQQQQEQKNKSKFYPQPTNHYRPSRFPPEVHPRLSQYGTPSTQPRTKLVVTNTNMIQAKGASQASNYSSTSPVGGKMRTQGEIQKVLQQQQQTSKESHFGINGSIIPPKCTIPVTSYAKVSFKRRSPSPSEILKMSGSQTISSKCLYDIIFEKSSKSNLGSSYTGGSKSALPLSSLSCAKDSVKSTQPMCDTDEHSSTGTFSSALSFVKYREQTKLLNMSSQLNDQMKALKQKFEDPIHREQLDLCINYVETDSRKLRMAIESTGDVEECTRILNESLNTYRKAIPVFTSLQVLEAIQSKFVEKMSSAGPADQRLLLAMHQSVHTSKEEVEEALKNQLNRKYDQLQKKYKRFQELLHPYQSLIDRL